MARSPDMPVAPRQARESFAHAEGTTTCRPHGKQDTHPLRTHGRRRPRRRHGFGTRRAVLLRVLLASQASVLIADGAAAWEDSDDTRRCDCAWNDTARVPIHGDYQLNREGTNRLGRLVHRLDGRSDNATVAPQQTSHLRECLLCHVTENLRARPQHLGVLTGKQLLVDDHLLASTSGVQRFLHTPFEHPTPVMEASETFEANGRYGFGFPGSVNHNGTHFVMHYIAGQRYDHSLQRRVGRIGVAVSVDGFKWKRRALDFYRFFPPAGGEHCVLLDEHEPDASLRWKMVHNCNQPVDETCLATSADGISWVERGHKWGRNVDRQACLYHDRPGGGYDYMLPQEFGTSHCWRDIRGTQLLHVSSDDFHRALLSNVTAGRRAFPLGKSTAGRKGGVPFRLERMWYLDRYEKLERYEHVIYYQTRTLYEGVYLGLLTALHWPTPGVLEGFNAKGKRELFAEVAGIEAWMHDRITPYLVTSRDARTFNFQWVYAKQPLVRGNTEQPEPMRVVMPAAQIVTWGRWHWLYYAGSHQPHTERWSAPAKIYLARFPKDRISGLETTAAARSATGGVIVTKPFRWPQGALTLSVNLQVGFVSDHDDGSSCAISLAGTQGTRLLHEVRGAHGHDGDELEAEVRVADLGLSDLGDVQMRFAMSGTVRIYAFTITCGPCGCDGHPTDVTCDEGSNFSKRLSGAARQLSQTVACRQPRVPHVPHMQLELRSASSCHRLPSAPRSLSC